ncbi:AAA family ATPase [Aeromonas caviae]|uniref:ATP-dependent nuclease n=2 Tax=Aeromonas TaxID=642 RepID=UPI0029D977EA|nr:AAA family ATPase [Aeromonas caviae]MDX7682860.1 AAA family ATPase [Aeromonas caviae]MDX7729202.1 AAA family ATPase [Aeromonas caviae]
MKFNDLFLEKITMHIEKIELKNFKAFKQIEINCNEKFNIIVGENNIGKSTIFEALNLWKFAYDRLIQERDKGRFYKASTNYHLPFTDLSQIRLVDDGDMFFNTYLSSASIAVTIRDGDVSFSLKIRFEKPTIKNSYLRIFNNDNFSEFERFANHIRNKACSLKNAIFIYQTRPVSTIFRNEPFYNNAQIEKKISIGKSHDVLRNKILKTENSQARRVAERFSRLEERLERVLKQKYQIRFKNKNRTDDEYVKITTECPMHKELEISMMGSGFLQVVEIFSTIEYIERHVDGICLILIDEPDSHIHSDLQSHLIDELKQHDDSQIFVITHNDRLISKANEGEVYYLHQRIKELGKLASLEMKDFPKVKTGLASVLSELERHDDRPLIITEGKTDQKILSTAWEKLYPGVAIPYRIISSGIQIDESSRSGSAETVRRTLEYLSTITELQIIGLFDNDREGNEQLKGLSKTIFEPHDILDVTRKHLTLNIYGMILPPPPHRVMFVTPNSITQRYFVMEHYFSDEILDAHHMRGEAILNTDVFEISGKKNDFSDNCIGIDREEFEVFKPLFSEFNRLFGID